MEKGRVLVTGGCGFIGSHIVDLLLVEGYEVAIVDNLSSGKKENIEGQDVKLFIADITKPEYFDAVKEFAPDYIIHEAAQVSVHFSMENIIEDTNLNIVGSVNVIESAKRFGVKKIIFASSAAVYGNPVYLPVNLNHPTNPLSPYGLSKLTVEKYLKLAHDIYGINYTVLRYSNVYGPRQDAKGEGGVIAIFSDSLASEQPITIYGDGEQTRDFIFVKDVAAANVKALKSGYSNVLNVSSYDKITVNDLYFTMADIIVKNAKPNYEAERIGDIKHSILDNSTTIEILNWKPNYSLREGLEQTLKFYQKL